MLASFSEFKFFQSFRVPVEKADNLRFLAERDNEVGKAALKKIIGEEKKHWEELKKLIA